MRRIVSLLAAGLIVSCTDAPVGVTMEGLAHPGPWQIPPDVEAVGETQRVTYTGAGPWVGRSGCAPSITPGGVVLKEWIETYWPEVSGVGGYSCRPVNGDSSLMSVHGTGRALDIYLETDGGEADNDLGDPIANWFILHAEEIGVQRIIWDRWNWHVGRTPRSAAYGGRHPHHDHIHLEISVAAANMETAWFSGPMGPPDRGVCGDPLPEEGGVIDDADACFQAFGNDRYWRRVDGVGEGGSILWTNAYESETPGNWARWRFHVGVDGTYRVEASSVAAYAVHPAVRYAVWHAGGRDEVIVDPSGVDGWTSLGEFDFAAGEESWVAVYDNYGPVPADQHITVDAVRLTRVSPAPGPDAGPSEPDAGPSEPDAGPSEPDAGVPVAADAGVSLDGSVGGDAGDSLGASGGCSAGGRGAPWAGSWLVLLWVVRRRRCVRG